MEIADMRGRHELSKQQLYGCRFFVRSGHRRYDMLARPSTKSFSKGTAKAISRSDMNGAPPDNGKLIHVHVCIYCGAISRREAFEGRALTSGIFSCPKCGEDGPLNVEIRSASEAQAT